MLYVNDKLVNLKDEEWKWLIPEFEKIKNKSNPLRIKIVKLPTIEKGAKEGYNPTGLKEPIKTVQWPLMDTIIRDSMTETWVYTKNKPNVKNGEIQIRTRRIDIKDGLLSLDTHNQTDLIYFLLNVSTFLKNRNYKVEDLEKEATDKIESVSPDAMLIFYLSSPVSPLFNKNEQVRELAYSWGISNAVDIGINQLKLKLKDTVINSERSYEVTNRGINDFLEEMNTMGRMTKYRSLLQKAKDKNLIAFDSKQNAWCWVSRTTGEYSGYIVPILPINLDQKDRLLFEYMVNNAQLFDQIENMIGNKPIEVKTNETTIETKYSHLLWKEVLGLAKSKKLITKGKKREEIESELLLTE